MTRLVVGLLLLLLSSASAFGATVRLQPSQVSFVGAYKLPAGFGNYSTMGATWNPTGDGGSGSLIAQGNLFTGQAAEFRPPTPQPLGSITTYANLPTATQLIAPADITGGLYGNGGQVHMSGLGYYDSGTHPAKVCFTMMDFYNVAPNPDNYLGCSNPPGQTASPGGLWTASSISVLRVGGHPFQIPTSVATRWQHPTWDLCFGFTRASGAFTGSQGPELICGSPWSAGDTFVTGAAMKGTPSPLTNVQELIGYNENSQCTNQHTNCEFTQNYQGPDQWPGAMYVSVGGTEALIFVGSKCTANTSYYCASAGWHCGPSSPGGTPPCFNTGEEYWMLFYDVDQIGQVAAGALAKNVIQPYAHLVLPAPFGVEGNRQYVSYGNLGYNTVAQQLHVIERFAGPGAQPAVHVLQLTSSGGSDLLAPAAPENVEVSTP